MNALPSRRHWNVEPGSDDENAKVAFLPSLILLGPESIVVSGGVLSDWVVSGGLVSTVKARLAASPVLPARSVARTEKVWGPSGTPLKVRGDAHGANAPPSAMHSK